VDTLQALLAALPDDPRTADILADFLEEQGDPRGEVLRLVYLLTRQVKLPDRAGREKRLRELLYQKQVHPVVPTRQLALGGERLVMAWIPPGTFRMGSPPREKGRSSGEKAHDVTLTHGFWMGVYPVTQAQWLAVVKKNPSEYRGGNLPVDNISWQMAQNYCAAATKLTKQKVRLPTEAEWEYACRAGTQTAYHFGKTLTRKQALFETRVDEERGTCEVGSFPPNGFGLYDVHGNVFEWVHDVWSDDYYDHSPPTDPSGPETGGDARILRGGSWAYDGSSARSAYRIQAGSQYAYYDQGFRVVCDHVPATPGKRR
jgi:formylglycine-generating enzyme required for sulfatase activity